MKILLVVCSIKKDRSVYGGFKSFLIFSSKDIIGPITPSMASPSYSSVQSRHAEIGCLKIAESLKKDPKKATMICTRWSYIIDDRKKITGHWNLDDGWPCKTCISYIKNKGIKKLWVSTKEGLIEASIDEAIKKSKPSTGLLYGR